MEIPYTVTARPDTGLFNSKIGIWLFLASEVMLFGGLFSGYIFLRLYADYPWPERTLPVLPGLINTFVLIGSSVTVVFAWASLKMRQWRRFQFFMAVTVACAGIFLVLKGIEYNAKWHHQAVRMNDHTILEGHTHKAKLVDGHMVVQHHGEGHGDAHGKGAGPHGEEGEKGEEAHAVTGSEFEANKILYKANSISYSLSRAHEPWVKEVQKQAAERKATLGAFDSNHKRSGFHYGSEEDRTPDDPATPEDEQAAAEAKMLEGELKGVTKPTPFGKNSIYFPEIGLFLYGDESDRIPDNPATNRRNEQDEAELKLLAEGLKDAAKATAFGKGSVYIPIVGVFLYGDADDFTPDNPGTKQNEQKEAERKLLLGGLKDATKPTPFGKNSLFIPGGTPLDYGLLQDGRAIFIEARSSNAKARTRELRRLWILAKQENPESKSWELSVEVDSDTIADELIGTTASLAFKVDPPSVLVLSRGQVKLRPIPKEGMQLKDDTSLSGHLVESSIAMAVDAVDFRFVAQQAESAGKKPMEVIEANWLFSEGNAHAAEFKAAWEMHKKRIAHLEEKLGKQGREPTDTERYRMGWKDLVQYARAQAGKSPEPGSKEFSALRPGMFEGFAGPSHKRKEYKEMAAAGHAPFLEVEVPQEKVALESKFTPKWNTYYAIYFTMTGLHGLHVVAGAIVLAYYLFFSKGLYRRNPEWLANRVEIGGLFWHFVDLVWIFLFPILYLM